MRGKPKSVSLAMAAVSAAVVLMSSAVAAQDRLVVFGQEVGAMGHFGQKLGDAPPWVRRSNAGDPEFIAGGRFLKIVEWEVRSPAEMAQVSHVFETLSGREVALPAAARVVVDALRPRVFLLDGHDVRAFDLDTGQTRVLAPARPVPPPPGWLGEPPVPAARYASGPSQLFVQRADGAGTAWEIAVIDVSTGVLVRTLPGFDPPFFTSDWTVTPDGSRLFASTASFVAGQSIKGVDAATGQVLASVPGFGPVLYDDAFERVFVTGSNGTGHTRVFDRQLNPLGTLDDGYCISNVRTSPHTGRVYQLRSAGGGGSYYGAIDTRVAAFDGQTGRAVGDASVTAALGLGTDRPVCGDYTMLLVTAPGAPRNLAASVSGHDVLLTWRNVGAATGFVLDVGLAPGRTDVSVYHDGGTTASFTGVPSGTYFVRVRGGNTFGGGRPSNEAVIVVP